MKSDLDSIQENGCQKLGDWYTRLQNAMAANPIPKDRCVAKFDSADQAAQMILILLRQDIGHQKDFLVHCFDYTEAGANKVWAILWSGQSLDKKKIKAARRFVRGYLVAEKHLTRKAPIKKNGQLNFKGRFGQGYLAAVRSLVEDS